MNSFTKTQWSPRTERRHRVVVIGGGFGGLNLARRLADEPIDLVIVDSRNHHTFQPLLYQVATAGLDADDICHPIRGIFHRQANVAVRMGTVIGVDSAEQALHLADGTTLDYDDLVVAAGAVTNSFGVPGVDEIAFGLKSVEDAMRIRAHVLAQFEMVSARPELIDDGRLTVTIAGGGPTGVELAGGMTELFHNVLRRDFPTVDVRAARVVLVEAGDRLLPTFHPRLGRIAKRTLESRGVEVLLDTAVVATSIGNIDLQGGRRVQSHTLIWATGVKAASLAASFPQAERAGGRIAVDERLAVVGVPHVWAIGDIAAARNLDGELLPQVSPAAIQAGAYVAESIVARRNGTEIEPFAYHDKGSMATIGRHEAVTELPNGLRLSGFVGWVAWLTLHLVMLIGFRNRANVLVNWAWNYLTYDRASRLIIEPAGRAAPPTGDQPKR